MNAFGTLSADVTHASARFPDDKKQARAILAPELLKRFDEINSEVTFAGYRFSERNYLTMGEYLDMRYREGYVGNSKELYTLQATKNFADLRLSTHINWSHQTYWNRPATDRCPVRNLKLRLRRQQEKKVPPAVAADKRMTSPAITPSKPTDKQAPTVAEDRDKLVAGASKNPSLPDPQILGRWFKALRQHASLSPAEIDLRENFQLSRNEVEIEGSTRFATP